MAETKTIYEKLHKIKTNAIYEEQNIKTEKFSGTRTK